MQSIEKQFKSEILKTQTTFVYNITGWQGFTLYTWQLYYMFILQLYLNFTFLRFSHDDIQAPFHSL